MGRLTRRDTPGKTEQRYLTERGAGSKVHFAMTVSRGVRDGDTPHASMARQNQWIRLSAMTERSSFIDQVAPNVGREPHFT